jgi:hypothetical protein
MKPEGVIDHRVAAGGGDTGVKDVGVRTGVGVAARAEAWRPGLRQIGTGVGVAARAEAWRPGLRHVGSGLGVAAGAEADWHGLAV